MLELKHVPLDESTSDFLVGPCDEELIVVIGLKEKEHNYVK